MTIETKINGRRLMDFGAEIVEYTVGPCDFDDTYILPPARVIPVPLTSRAKLRTITITLDFSGTAHDVAMSISKMTAMFFGEVHLVLPDGFGYWCAYDKASTPKEKAPWIWQVKFTFVGTRHGAKQTILLSQSASVFIDGNVETPAIVTITPEEETTEVTFNGITVVNLSGPVTIDGLYTTVLDSDSNNKFADTDMTEWPKLQPGFFDISVSGAAVFEIGYYPIYL